MSNSRIELIKHLTRVTSRDIESVGTYAQGLSVLLNSGVPIPPSVIVTKEALEYFLEFSGVKQILVKETQNSACNLRRIERSLLEAKFPPVFSSELHESYRRISGFTDSYVCIQPLLYTKGSSMPLKQELKRYAFGIKNVLDLTKRVWADIFCSPTNEILQILENRVSISVLIGKAPLEEVSGMMHTSDITTSHTNNLWVEAVYGMWEIVEKEGLIPDQYIYSKEKNKVVDKHIGKQQNMIIRQLFKDSGILEKVPVSSLWQTIQKLNDKYLTHLAKIGVSIEKFYKAPCEITWVYEGGKLWITSIDPSEKTIYESRTLQTESADDIDSLGLTDIEIPTKPKLWTKAIKSKTVVVRGIGNKAGYVEGIARKKFTSLKTGNNEKAILVCSDASRLDDAVLQGLSGLVLDSGDTTEPMLIRTNMLGIPSVIGTSISTRVLRDGAKIWVDSVKGVVYSDPPIKSSVKRTFQEYQSAQNRKVAFDWSSLNEMKKTATKVYLRLNKLSYTHLLQAEMFAEYLDGAVCQGVQTTSLDTLASFTRSFYAHGKPSLVYSVKQGSLQSTAGKILALRNSEGIRSVSIILPRYTSKEDIVEQKRTLLDLGLRRSSSFNIFSSITTPGALFSEDSISDSIIDGIVIFAKPLQKLIAGRQSNKVLRETAVPIADFVRRASKNRFEIFLDIADLRVTSSVFQELLSSGLFGIITSSAETVPSLKRTIANAEYSAITSKKRRSSN